MWNSIIVTLVGALSVFILGRISARKSDNKAEAKEKAQAETSAKAAEVVAETLTKKARSDEFFEQKRTELEDANRRGNFNAILRVANELLEVVKEAK